MKQAKKPTRIQKEIIRNNHLVVNNWSVLSDLGAHLKLINKTSKKIRIVTKYPGRKNE